MKISEHHQRNLKAYEERFGLSCLENIIHRINKSENTRMICRMFGLELYEVRYLMQIQSDVSVYLYERQHKPQLKLVYFESKMVA